MTVFKIVNIDGFFSENRAMSNSERCIAGDTMARRFETQGARCHAMLESTRSVGHSSRQCVHCDSPGNDRDHQGAHPGRAGARHRWRERHGDRTSGDEVGVPVHKYEAVELTLNRRMANNWTMITSYRWSRLRGNFEGFHREDNGQSDPGISSLYDFPTNDPTYTSIGTALGYPGDIRFLNDPNGILPLDRPHQGKIFANYAAARFRMDRAVQASRRSTGSRRGPRSRANSTSRLRVLVVTSVTVKRGHADVAPFFLCRKCPVIPRRVTVATCWLPP
jgi:hypothetical protein